MGKIDQKIQLTLNLDSISVIFFGILKSMNPDLDYVGTLFLLLKIAFILS